MKAKYGNPADRENPRMSLVDQLVMSGYVFGKLTQLVRQECVMSVSTPGDSGCLGYRINVLQRQMLDYLAGFSNNNVGRLEDMWKEL